MVTSLGLWSVITHLAGGVGLFLLGMTMMTDGLKLAAGPALERILASATRTRWQALGSGMLVTALVQSSSAITVATIGFVNAGLLSLGSALWVLFGANVGTTMTGWIVALVGLKFNIETLALPLIGLGVVMRLTGAGQRRGAVGTTLAGFGLLFFGISMLQTSFTGLATQISLPQGTGPLAVLAQVGGGALMTVLMQSSSASMTIALTAAQGGLLTPQGAAAVVIGANIGTTVTAMLASMGATPNARRAASAHVAFNVITGAVALILLPWLIDALGLARAALGLPADPAAKLALFHTIFNVLGVLLMWPLAAPLTRWLQARFRAREDDEAQTRYLDDNVLQVPSLAVDALQREVSRVGHVAVRMARAAGAGADAPALARDQAVFTQLITAVEGFVERLSRRPLSQKTSEQLTQVLRVLRYHESITEQVHACAPLHALVDCPALAEHHQDFVARCDALLAACDPQEPDQGPNHVEERSQKMEAAYETLKTGLLAVGATGGVRLASMEEALRRYSALRRAAQQATKARRRWPAGTRNAQG